MQKKLYMGSNLKMYKTIEETTAFLKELTELTADIDRETLSCSFCHRISPLTGSQRRSTGVW